MFNATHNAFLRLRLIDHQGASQALNISDDTPKQSLFGYSYYKPFKMDIQASEEQHSVMVQLEKGCLKHKQFYYDHKPEELAYLHTHTNIYIHILDDTSSLETFTNYLNKLKEDSLHESEHVALCLNMDEQALHAIQDYVNHVMKFPPAKSWPQQLQQHLYSLFAMDSAEKLDVPGLIRELVCDYKARLKAKGLPLRSSGLRENFLTSQPWPYSLRMMDCQHVKAEAIYYKALSLKVSDTEYFMAFPISDLPHLVREYNINLIASRFELMLEEPHRLWELDELDFFNLCKVALLKGHIDIVILFYKYLPKFNIEINASSLQEFINNFQSIYRKYLIKRFNFTPFSVEELAQLEAFDAADFRAQQGFGKIEDVDNYLISLLNIHQYSFDSPVAHAIKTLFDNLLHRRFQRYKLTLIALASCEPENQRLWKELPQIIFKCLQACFLMKRLDLVLFTFAYLPIIKNTTSFANNDPIKFFREHFILNVQDMFFLDAHCRRIVRAFDEGVPTEADNTEEPFFTTMAVDSSGSSLSRAYSYAEFSIQLRRLLETSLETSGVRFAITSDSHPRGGRRLLSQVFYPYQALPSLRGGVLSDLDKSKAYDDLFFAISNNRKEMVIACMRMLKKKHSLVNVLTRKYMSAFSLLETVFLRHSLDALAGILTFPECKQAVYDHIKSRRYIGITFQDSSEIFRALLDGNTSCLQSKKALAVSCHQEDYLPSDLSRFIETFDELFFPFVLSLTSRRKSITKLISNSGYLGLINSIRIFLEMNMPRSRVLSMVATL